MVLRYNSGNKGGIRLSKLNYSYHPEQGNPESHAVDLHWQRAGLFSFPVRDTAEPVQRAVLRPSGHCSRAGLAALQLYFHVRRDRRYEHLLHFQRCSRALLLLLARPLSGAALGLTAREPVLSDRHPGHGCLCNAGVFPVPRFLRRLGALSEPVDVPLRRGADAGSARPAVFLHPGQNALARPRGHRRHSLLSCKGHPRSRPVLDAVWQCPPRHRSHPGRLPADRGAAALPALLLA